MPRAEPCRHRRAVRLAADAQLWGEECGPRGTVRWCCHCGAVQVCQERWYEPRSMFTAQKLHRQALAGREVQRGTASETGRV